MPEHQQIHQSTESKSNAQKQVTTASPTHASNPYSIIQRAKINPKSLTHADIMQLQRTIGNRAVGMLLSNIENTSTVQQATVQRQEIPEKEEPLQGKMAETVQKQDITEEEEQLQGKFSEPIQLQEIPESEEEEPSLQGKFENNPEQETCPSCSTLPIQRETENRMPDDLKTGVESLSRMDMSDVRVHYNSSKPADVGALAYTQGINIHVAPGQEEHLPHEARHVVQQAQGRVRPTMQLKDGAPVNDDEGLEHEADVKGDLAILAKEAKLKENKSIMNLSTVTSSNTIPNTVKNKVDTIQAVWEENPPNWKWDILISGVRWHTDGTLYWYTIEEPEGNVYSDFAEQKRTHVDWKALGAGDLPEGDLHYEAMHSTRPKKGETPIIWGPLTMTRNEGTEEKPKIKIRGSSTENPFYRWLYKNEENPKNMNCYEVVLYTAVLAGIRTKRYVKKMIFLNPESGGPAFASKFNVSEIPRTGMLRAKFFNEILPKTLVIPRGHVVLFGPNGEHVALSEGKTKISNDSVHHLVLELDQNTNGVQSSSIEEITLKYSYIGWGPLP